MFSCMGVSCGTRLVAAWGAAAPPCYASHSLPPQALVPFPTDSHSLSNRSQMELDAEMLKKMDAAKMESMVGPPTS